MYSPHSCISPSIMVTKFTGNGSSSGGAALLQPEKLKVRATRTIQRRYPFICVLPSPKSEPRDEEDRSDKKPWEQNDFHAQMSNRLEVLGNLGISIEEAVPVTKEVSGGDEM